MIETANYVNSAFRHPTGLSSRSAIGQPKRLIHFRRLDPFRDDRPQMIVKTFVRLTLLCIIGAFWCV